MHVCITVCMCVYCVCIIRHSSRISFGGGGEVEGKWDFFGGRGSWGEVGFFLGEGKLGGSGTFGGEGSWGEVGLFLEGGGGSTRNFIFGRWEGV